MLSGSVRIGDRPAPRLWTQSQPEHVDYCECDGIAKGSGELVVAGSHPAKVLEAADRRLDAPSLLVGLFVMADFDDPVFLSRNDRLDAIVAQLASQSVGIKSAVGDETFAGPDLGEQRLDAPDIAVLAGGQVDGDRPSEKVGGDMDFGGAPASRDANRLILRRFFWAPAAERWALT